MKKSGELEEKLKVAEEKLKESQDELALQRLQNEQMKIALQSSNKRRFVAKDELDRLLTNPILSTTKPSTSHEVLQKEHQVLWKLLKDIERQLGLMTQMFLQKEQELQNQIKSLQIKLEEAQREAVLKE